VTYSLPLPNFIHLYDLTPLYQLLPDFLVNKLVGAAFACLLGLGWIVLAVVKSLRFGGGGDGCGLRSIGQADSSRRFDD